MAVNWGAKRNKVVEPVVCFVITANRDRGPLKILEWTLLPRQNSAEHSKTRLSCTAHVQRHCWHVKPARWKMADAHIGSISDQPQPLEACFGGSEAPKIISFAFEVHEENRSVRRQETSTASL